MFLKLAAGVDWRYELFLDRVSFVSLQDGIDPKRTSACKRCVIESDGQIAIPANGDHAVKARVPETGPVLAAFTFDNAEYAKPQARL